jgi:hypothetical protein
LGSQLETTGLTQKAVLWEFSGGVDDYGKACVDGPKEIDVRWEHTRKKSASSETDAEQVVARIIVDRLIAPNSLLWRGKIVDLPPDPKDLVKVVEYREIPDVKGRNLRRSVFVSKYSNNIPTK